jgi:hypothetical protein
VDVKGGARDAKLALFCGGHEGEVFFLTTRKGQKKKKKRKEKKNDVQKDAASEAD